MEKNRMIDRMIEKSIEAFILALEVYNKPTIKYRIEGFSFFICNAWELMLKAHMINRYGEKSIYHKNSNNRTLSLEGCIDKIFDKYSSLRENLENIIDLRNTSTHFITEEYEYIYAPLFQACIINYQEKMKSFHNREITDYITQNFLMLSIKMDSIDEEKLKGKYSVEIVEKILKDYNNITNKISENNSSFSIPVYSNFYITKNKDNADLLVGIDNSSNTKVKIVKQISDPNNIYIYATKDIVKQVNKKLKEKEILLLKNDNNNDRKIFNKYDFNLFEKFYNIKNDENFSFYYKVGNRYSYSQKLVNFIVEEITKNPNRIIIDLKKNIKKER